MCVCVWGKGSEWIQVCLLDTNRLQLVQALDKAIGYHFPTSEDRNEWVLEGVAVSNTTYLRDLADVQERFVDRSA